MPVTLSDIHQSPGYLLRRSFQIATAIAAEELEKHELTAPQFLVLVGIRDNPGIDITTLSGLVVLDRSTLGGILDRLELKELIFRQPLKTDKRVKLLYLNREGQSALSAAEHVVIRSKSRLLAPLSAKERNDLVVLLTRLVKLQNGNMPAGVRGLKDRTDNTQT